MARQLLFARVKRERAAAPGASPPSLPLAPARSSDEETLLDGHMRLYAFYTPALEGGSYTVAASQSITSCKESSPQSTTLQNQLLVQSPSDPKLLVPGKKVVQVFDVVAPQFSLDPKFINSYYPPSGEQDQGRVLPHIVFNDPHIPWLRDAGVTHWSTDPISGAPSGMSWAGRTKVPWMALLVFQPNDLRVDSTSADLLGLGALDAWTKSIPDKPPINYAYSMSVSEFMSLTSRVKIETGLAPQSQDWNDMMASSEQTRAIFPTEEQILKIFSASAAETSAAGTSLVPLNSLQLMSHVRHVNNRGLPDYDPLDSAYFSVVVSGMTGNITEMQLSTHIVHLVSIEHLDTTLSLGLNGPSKRIALVSLFSWNYGCVPESVDLATTMETLAANAQPLRAPAPVLRNLSTAIDSEVDTAKKTGMQSLLKRLQHGYTITRWRDALGEESIAFNRGPLVPVHLKSQASDDETAVPHQPSPDWPVTSMTGKNYQVFDTLVGVMDATYSSAWSLGKLIAISDGTFTAALMRLRSRTRTMAVSASLMEVNHITDRKALITGTHEAIASTHRVISHGCSGPVSRLNPAPASTGPKSLVHRDVQPILRGKIFDAVKARTLSTAGTVWTGLDDGKPHDSDWEIVSNWIHDTLFLAKIPAHYLFPDPAFLRGYLDASTLPKDLTRLAPEALRYFSIDETWLDTYIDGALSIANHVDPEKDTVRLALKSMINLALATGGTAGTAIPVPRSGFVLRSAAVKAAPDLRVSVTRYEHTDTGQWREDENYDPLLRHTRLDDYTILTLLDISLDQIFKIVISQPPHQQRFAFSVNPTIDAETGAVTATENKLRFKALYTNEDIAPEGAGTAGEWGELPPQYQLTPQQEAGFYDPSTRCIAPDEIARHITTQLGAWNAATENSPYTDSVPDSCVVGLELNDPCYQLVISGTPPTVTSAFVSKPRQLWVGPIDTPAVSSSGGPLVATRSTQTATPLPAVPISESKTVPGATSASGGAGSPGRSVVAGNLTNNRIKLPVHDTTTISDLVAAHPWNSGLHLHRTAAIPLLRLATTPPPTRPPNMPPPDDWPNCQFELLVHPDYRPPPPRPSPPWKSNSNALYSPQAQCPVAPLYLYDLVLATRRRFRHSPGVYELKQLYIEIPIEDSSDTRNPSDGMWREPLLVGGNYAGKGLQMTGNQRFVPTLSSSDKSTDDGKGCLRITLVPRSGEEEGSMLLHDDNACAEASVRLSEVRLAGIVDTRTKVLIQAAKDQAAVPTAAGRSFVKMTEVYSSGQQDQQSWAVVLKTVDKDKDAQGREM